MVHPPTPAPPWRHSFAGAQSHPLVSHFCQGLGGIFAKVYVELDEYEKRKDKSERRKQGKRGTEEQEVGGVKRPRSHAQ